MPSSLVSEMTSRRVMRFGGFCFCALALVTSLSSRGFLRGSHASVQLPTAVVFAPPASRLNIHGEAAADRTKDATSTTAVQSYGKLPLSFEANDGQANREVKFMARGQGYGLFLTSNGALLTLATPANRLIAEGNAGPSASASSGVKSTLMMRFKGSRSVEPPRGLDELPGKANYFIGSQAKDWRTNVSLYAKVSYSNIYPGIDLVYYGNQRELEYDLLVAPGASPRRIRMAFAGAQMIRVDSSGDLVLSTAAGDIRQPRPIAYQQVNDTRRDVAAGYRLYGNEVRFEVGTYDKKLPLMIDPVLIYSSFLGGTSTEQGLGIAVDAQGSAYLTGSTASIDFPLVSPLQNTKDAFNDAFVVKLNPAGTGLVYATYLGANGDDFGNAIAVDSQGSAYVAGLTGSGSFPTTGGPFQATKGGSIDGFLAKLNPSGSSLVYSTFLGGDNTDSALGIAVDAANRMYVVGRTDSTRLGFFPLQRHGNPLYKSTDGAGNWSASSNGLTASAVNCLTPDPVTGGTLYAGTSLGVFKSTDAGASWNLTGTNPPVSAPLSTNAVVIDPSNSSTVYAATTQGIYKSTNGAGIYTQKNSGLTSLAVFALALDPNSPAILYAGTQTGVFKTTNGGDNWVAMNNGTSNARINKIAIDPSQNPATTIYLGTSGRGMLKTTNGGGLWTAINNGALILATFPQINALAIDPLNPSTLYVGAGPFSGFFKTTNGGGTWSSSSSGLTFMLNGQPATPTVIALAVDPLTPATIYAGTSGGAIYKSVDGAANWNQSNAGFINTTATAITIDRSNPANLYAATNIGFDAFAIRFNSSGALDYLVNFGGDESDEARGVAVESDGSAYIVGVASSSNLPVTSAFQSTSGGFADCFVAKLNSAGSAFVYLTYLGGSLSDQGTGISVRAGSAYVVGSTSSQNFPLARPIKTTLADFDSDAFVARLGPAGNTLDFSTFLGGENIDQGFGIAVDESGNAYVTGSTSSSAFPTLNAVQPTLSSAPDAFVTEINPTAAAMVYSTYLGGVSSDQGNGIAVDSFGNAYVTGNTSSANFPTARAFQSSLKVSDAFVSKLGIDVDLSISQTDSRDPVLVNSPFTYTLTVINNGPSPGTGVTVTDTLPAGLSFNSVTPTQGSCSRSNAVITCNLGGLASANGAAIAISVTPTTVATIVNTATVTGNEPDANAANNTASESTKVSASPSIRGRVKDAGNNGVSGVLMTLTGTQAGTTQTDSSGFYQFAELPLGGNYVVTPSKTNLSFDPESQPFTLNSDQTADFLASTCTYSIAPLTQSFISAGGQGSVNVTSLHGCPWTATSSVGWTTITSGASGIGSGIVNYTVSATSVPRAGHLTIAGQNFSVYQEFNSCGAPGFSVDTYNIQDSPTVVRIADLNGDGFPDVALVTNGLSGGGIRASVMLNNRSGGFTTSNFDTGLGVPQGFVLADFNGDGKPDIAMTSYNFSSVRIFFNNGTGGFGQSNVDIPFTSQGQSPLTRDLQTADLNKDGKADLVVSTPGPNSAQVLLGNGSGGFTQIAPVNLGTSFGSGPIDIADFNNDGIQDLLLAAGQSSTPLGVMLGNGSGGFSPVIASGGINSVTTADGIGDFDGDGNLDVVVPTTISNPSFTGFAVMAGDGTGHFTRKSTFSVERVNRLTVADLNNDGKADVAYTAGDNKVTVLTGDGVGGLSSSVQIATGPDSQFPGNFGIAAADFNGDGRPDLAVANYTVGASVLRNNCAAAPSISGRVTDGTANGVGGVDITLGPGQAITTRTDAGGNYFIGNLTPGANYIVTPARVNFRFSPASVNINGLSGNQTANFVATPIKLQFTQIHYLVDENAGSIRIDVSRTGDLAAITTVDYATMNGTASDRSDYTAAVGTLRFAPGEALKSFNVLITDDALVEGFESLTLTLSNANGAILATSLDFLPSTVLMEIRDNDSSLNPANPIDNASFFVRQHYHDFLNREPDTSGLNFWTNEITSCGSDQACVEAKRVNVSAAFFLSIEFQDTGYLVERMYKASYGNANGTSTFGGSHQIAAPIIRFNEFLPDTQEIGLGVIVGQGDWQPQLENNKQAFTTEFVQRSRFTTAYPTSLTPAQFVNTLFTNAGLPLSGTDYTQAINDFGGASNTANNTARASALRRVSENSTLQQQEFNRAFVLMQYFGYLRRNPNDVPDSDYTGFDFWLTKLNQFNGNFVNADMVKAFITSAEYRQRFGP